ncbi:MAG TPA: HAD hydrolase-like protein, partial [Firmicutes bacterium]|nr:HAD hydrolase-like protein [Bacillota bacterium]
IAAALEFAGAKPADSVMIGDRKFDMLGAAANGLDAIGVTYGYGNREELLGAGALHIADSTAELGRLLLTN